MMEHGADGANSTAVACVQALHQSGKVCTQAMLLMMTVKNLCMKVLIVKLTAIGKSFKKKKYELHAIGLEVLDRINSHDKTLTQHEVCSAGLCI